MSIDVISSVDDPYDPGNASAQLDTALQTRNIDLIVDVARTHAWTLVVHDYPLLMRALEVIPVNRLQQTEVLALVHPRAAALARANGASEPADQGPILDHASLTARQIDESLTTQMIARRLRGDLKSALDLAARLEERILSARRPERDQETRTIPHFLFQVGVTYLLDGQVDRALNTLTTARQLAAFEEGNHIQRDASAKLAIAHAFKGSVSLAERDLTQSRALPPAPPFFSGFIDSSERIADAIIQIEKMSPHAEERVQALDPFDTPDEFWPFVVLARARFELARSNPVEALDIVALAFETHSWQAKTLAEDVRIAMSADAFLCLGEVGSAAALTRELEPQMVLSRLSRIRVFLRSGDTARAARECRALSGSSSVPAAVRDEAIVLRAWSSVAADGAVEEGHARAIVQIAAAGQRRRIFTCVPSSILEEIAGGLTGPDAARFRQSLDGLLPAPEALVRPKLTPGESKVLSVLRDDITTSQIAEMLFLSPNTVKSQLASIYRKLGATSRSDAIAQAARMNLLD